MSLQKVYSAPFTTDLPRFVISQRSFGGCEVRLALTQFLLQSPDGRGVAVPVPREPEALERHHSTTAHNSITAHHPPLDRLAHRCTLNAYTNELLLSGGNALRVY